MASPKLTLSQRRALLHALDYAPFVVESRQTRAAFDHLVAVGYGRFDEDGFRLTPAGRERALSVNPGYRDWKPGGSVLPTARPQARRVGIPVHVALL